MNFEKMYFEGSYKEKALMLLKDLISFPSFLTEYKADSKEPFGKANREVLEYMLNYAKEDGFDVVNADNYAGHIEFGTGELLGILCHLDVVPVNNLEWKTEPFTLTLKGDKLFGRGVMDDKGPFVATYIALKMLKDEGFYPSMKVRLIFGCDEESGSRCLEHYYKHFEKPKLGFSPDAEFPIINGEKGIISYNVHVSDEVIKEFSAGLRYNMVPSLAKAKLNVNLDKEFISYVKENKIDGEIVDGYYQVKGLGAHAMVPEKGINAAYLLFEFINKYTDSKLAEYVTKYFTKDVNGKKIGYYDTDPLMGELTSNFAVVDIKDGKGYFGVNCRVPKNEDFKLIEDKVNESTKDYSYEFELLSASNRHFVDPSSKLVKTLMKVYQKVTKDMEHEPFTIGGGTYAREIEGAVAFGPLFPGREDVCHIANEYMYLDDFNKLVEIYYHAIKELTK